MKIVAIVQARMSSTRLPGKMMMTILDKPVIQHVIERVRLSKKINEVWLATTTETSDDVLAKWAEENHVLCCRGSQDDVLGRVYRTAVQAQAEVVVRITGDCPLHDYRVIDKVIDFFLNQGGQYDYVSNANPPTFPDGLDAEVFKFSALERAWQEAQLKSEREHVTPYIYKHPEIFSVGNVANIEDLSDWRWTLDTLEDFKFISLIMEACFDGYRGLEEIIGLLNKHPEWQKINSQHLRNEGYKKSLLEDEKMDKKQLVAS